MAAKVAKSPKLPKYASYRVSDSSLVNGTVAQHTPKSKYAAFPYPITPGVVLDLLDTKGMVVAQYKSYLSRGKYTYRAMENTARSVSGVRNSTQGANLHINEVLSGLGYNLSTEPSTAQRANAINRRNVADPVKAYFLKNARRIMGKSTAPKKEVGQAFFKWVQTPEASDYIRKTLLPEVQAAIRNGDAKLASSGSKAIVNLDELANGADAAPVLSAKNRRTGILSIKSVNGSLMASVNGMPAASQSPKGNGASRRNRH